MPGWPEVWIAERPSPATKREREREQLAAWKRWRAEGVSEYPPYPGLIGPEEWERLRNEIGVKSTNPREWWDRHWHVIG